MQWWVDNTSYKHCHKLDSRIARRFRCRQSTSVSHLPGWGYVVRWKDDRCYSSASDAFDAQQAVICDVSTSCFSCGCRALQCIRTATPGDQLHPEYDFMECCKFENMSLETLMTNQVPQPPAAPCKALNTISTAIPGEKMHPNVLPRNATDEAKYTMRRPNLQTYQQHNGKGGGLFLGNSLMFALVAAHACYCSYHYCCCWELQAPFLQQMAAMLVQRRL